MSRQWGYTKWGHIMSRTGVVLMFFSIFITFFTGPLYSPSWVTFLYSLAYYPSFWTITRRIDDRIPDRKFNFFLYKKIKIPKPYDRILTRCEHYNEIPFIVLCFRILILIYAFVFLVFYFSIVVDFLVVDIEIPKNLVHIISNAMFDYLSITALIMGGLYVYVSSKN